MLITPSKAVFQLQLSSELSSISLGLAIPPFAQHSFHAAAAHSRQQARLYGRKVVIEFTRVIHKLTGRVEQPIIGSVAQAPPNRAKPTILALVGRAADSGV